MSKHDYTSGNLLYFSNHQKYYKHIGFDLSRQTNTSIPRHMNFTRKLEDDGATWRSLLLKNGKRLF